MTTLDLQESLLFSLAPELIQAISDELDLSALSQLRLTCKAMTEFLNSQIFRTLTLQVSRVSIEKGLSLLKALSTANHPACYAARNLVIGSLSPSYDPAYRPVCTFEGNKWVTNPPPDEPPEIAVAEENMSARLFDAIASLKGVQSVEWTPNAKDSESTHRTVMDALKTLPDLHRFKARLPNLKIALELDALTNLQEIIMEETQMHQEDILESLAKAAAQNSGLTSIDISSSWRYHRETKFQSLHQIFKYCPPAAPPLRLRHLGLRIFLLRLDDITMPHLTHLTSLSLTGIEDPFVTRPRYTSSALQQQEDPVIMQERMRCGSSLEEVWKALRHVGVGLEAITVDAVPQSFLDYLSSYSGLKELQLTPSGFYDGTSSDIIARRFFEGPLAGHSRSLEDLQIASLYEGLWCFGSHNVNVVSKCTKLKNLRMSIISNQLAPEKEKQSSDTAEPDAMKLLIDTVVLFMPNIDSVQVAGANRENLRGARCGNPSMHHFARVNKSMSRSVSNYTAPASCHRLPSLMLSSGRSLYVGERPSSSTTGLTNGDGAKQGLGPLRYVNISPTPRPIDEEYDEWY